MRKYDSEFKKEALRKYLDGQSVASISRELGVNEGLLHKWKKELLPQSGTDDNEKLQMRKRIIELEQENAHPKKGGHYLRAKRIKRYEFIEAEQINYQITMLCRVMKVARSAYYAYRSAKSYVLSQKKAAITKQVKEVFTEHRRRYGSRRITAELKARGEKVGRFAVRSRMKAEKLEAIRPKRFVPKTTTSNNGLASPNLLKNEANEPTKPKDVIIGDITYLPLCSGKWSYLATFQDKYTRRIVGWSVSNTMTEELVTSALRKALEIGRINRDAIIHTDRGSQYSSHNFRLLLTENGLRQSMSGRGNCYDNAQAESFFARFKIELLEGGLFADVFEARSETFSYIEGYYNRVRRHSSLGNKSPQEFETELENLRKGAMSKSFLSSKT